MEETLQQATHMTVRMTLGNKGTDITRKRETLEMIKLGIIASIVIMRRIIDMIETMKTTIIAGNRDMMIGVTAITQKVMTTNMMTKTTTPAIMVQPEDPLAITTILDVEDMDREDTVAAIGTNTQTEGKVAMVDISTIELGIITLPIDAGIVAIETHMDNTIITMLPKAAKGLAVETLVPCCAGMLWEDMRLYCSPIGPQSETAIQQLTNLRMLIMTIMAPRETHRLI